PTRPPIPWCDKPFHVTSLGHGSAPALTAGPTRSSPCSIGSPRLAVVESANPVGRESHPPDAGDADSSGFAGLNRKAPEVGRRCPNRTSNVGAQHRRYLSSS